MEKPLVLILKMMIQPLIIVTFLSPHVPTINGEEVDDVHANSNDHDEGELINII